MKRTIVAVVGALFVLAGASATPTLGRTPRADTASRSLAGSPLLRRLPPLAKRCSEPRVRATAFRFKAGDGVLLDGAVLGRGPVGIVLAHESGGDLCRWVPYGDRLSRKGFRVLVFDYRGFGLSAKVAGERAARIDLDVLAAVAALRRRGAEKIVLIGASVGGVAVVTAAASARPAVAGVVSISGADTSFLQQGGFPYAVLDPSAAAARLTSAALFVASRDDTVLPVASTQKLYREAAATDKRIVVVPGFSHGISIVDDSGRTGSKVRGLILKFIREHTGN
jgi:pimeloyl-ACP methyl ester carboxylesterase